MADAAVRMGPGVDEDDVGTAGVDHETPPVGGSCSLIAKRTTAERSAEAPFGAVP